MEEKFIMVSMGDEKSKYIAEVLGNSTCKKILDYLAEKESTITEVSNNLKIPLNTVDYNIKKLIQSGLIEKASFFWSIKGKKMPTFKVSNKRIIISPRKSVLTSVFLSFIITGISAFLLKVYGVSQSIADNSIAVEKAAGLLQASSELSYAMPPETYIAFGNWAWFLLGAWFAIVLIIILNLRNK